ncbi:hypothetical protein DFH11DRAFT_1589073 [Phellopilus nigrolimitatus]|nr:hypothetical protein DFH11DRAFT_1589073 [Phellopilus nigrolimitatus]
MVSIFAGAVVCRRCCACTYCACDGTLTTTAAPVCSPALARPRREKHILERLRNEPMLNLRHELHAVLLILALLAPPVSGKVHVGTDNLARRSLVAEFHSLRKNSRFEEITWKETVRKSEK